MSKVKSKYLKDIEDEAKTAFHLNIINCIVNGTKED